MNEGNFGLMLLVILAIAVTITVRFFKEDKFGCIGTSTLITLIIFHIASYLHAGELDKFLLVALIMSFIYVLFLSSASYFVIWAVLKFKSNKT